MEDHLNIQNTQKEILLVQQLLQMLRILILYINKKFSVQFQLLFKNQTFNLLLILSIITLGEMDVQFSLNREVLLESSKLKFKLDKLELMFLFLYFYKLIQVPLPMFSFTGNKRSFMGDTNFYGKSGVNFFTQLKTITAKWKEDEVTKLSTAMPTYK